MKRIGILIVMIGAFFFKVPSSSSFQDACPESVKRMSASFFAKRNTTYRIKKVYDLEGSRIQVAENCKIIIDGGKLINGTLVGDNTIIEVKRNNVVFEGMSFGGSYIMPIIKTDYFNIDRNTLVNLFSLTDNSIENEVIINHDLEVSIPKEWYGVVTVDSNTDILLNANIHLLPSSYKGGNIFYVDNCENVTFSGSGHLIGDLVEHQGTDGECIYGIFIANSSNVTIKEITCEYFWGDGIYIYPGGITHKRGQICNNILIDNVTCNYNRRQGISVVGGSNIVIKNSRLENTGVLRGTAPMSGIDIEPANHYDYQVDNVIIKNCFFKNNGVYARRPCPQYNDIMVVGNNERVRIVNCSVQCIFFWNSSRIELDSCSVARVLHTIDNNKVHDISIKNSTIAHVLSNFRRIKNVSVFSSNIGRVEREEVFMYKEK